MIKNIYYKGEGIDVNDLRIVWTDHWGKKHDGSLMDYVITESDDAVEEATAGMDW